jgi:hypothetical protein
MAVSSGGSEMDGEGNSTRSVITAAPGTAQFDGVWLIGEAWGQQATSPNVGISLEPRGLTVTGPAPGQTNTLPWTWVQRFVQGEPMTFPDGSAATVVEVVLVGRSITLLVPPDQLRVDEIEELNGYVPAPVQVAEPAAPFEALSDEEAIHFTDGPEQTTLDSEPRPPEAAREGGKAERATNARATKDRAGDDSRANAEAANARARNVSGRSKLDRRTSKLAILLACLVAVAIVGTAVVALRIHDDDTLGSGIVIPVVPATNAPPAPSTLTGPAASVAAKAVDEDVDLRLSDLPTGWSRVVAVPKAPVPSTFADVNSNSNQRLASCLGLPLSHVGIITGEGEPGGPQVWPSNIYVMNSGLHPSAISVASLVSSATVEQSDLAALLRPGTSHCLDNYYASSFASDHITEAPRVNLFDVPGHAGEEVIGLDVHIGITQKGSPPVYDYDVVVIGAGRLEIALGAQQDNEPFPGSVLDQAVQDMEARAAVAAGGH